MQPPNPKENQSFDPWQDRAHTMQSVPIMSGTSARALSRADTNQEGDPQDGGV
jgi:hypothetical protein